MQTLKLIILTLNLTKMNPSHASLRVGSGGLRLLGSLTNSLSSITAAYWS